MKRDAFAAAIAASALLELCIYVDAPKAKEYFNYAETALESLSSPMYFAEDGNQNFLIKHAVGHKPAKSEVDTPLIYADYYYIGSLLRYNNLEKKKFR